MTASERLTPSMPSRSVFELKGPNNAAYAAFVDAVTSGFVPFSEGLQLDSVGAMDDVLAAFPGKVTIERLERTHNATSMFLRCEHGFAYVSLGDDRTSIHLCCPSLDELGALAGHIRDHLPAEPVVCGTAYRRWTLSPFRRAAHTLLHDDFPRWNDIRPNYPGAIRAALDQLMAYVATPHGPKLILWHGPAGTGKTTALKALLREWETWCIGEYILDPEVFFNEPPYMVDVIRHESTRTPLIIAEDCDDYLRAGGRTNHGLSRFLNLTDGLLGSKSDAMVLVTTNEDLGRIHPAVTRPGRCLAQIEYGLFEPSEARRWRRRHNITAPTNGAPKTLAELYHDAGATTQITAASVAAAEGHQYL